MKKYCPIAAHGEMIAAVLRQDDYERENIFCDKDRCAWYDSENKQCVIKSLAYSLEEIVAIKKEV